MIKKLFILEVVALIVLTSALFTGCAMLDEEGSDAMVGEETSGSNSDEEREDRGWYVDATDVDKIPAGFVLLDKESEDWIDGLSIVSWESQISFVDADGYCIYQTGYDDGSFIVKHNDKYYVNADQLSEIFEIASDTNDKRGKTYYLGDAVELRGFGDKYLVTIYGMETRSVNEEALTIINYSITPSVPSHKLEKLFEYVVTDRGAKNRSFINMTDREVSVKHSADKNISAIVLNSPDRLFQESHRMVLLEYPPEDENGHAQIE